MCGVWMIPRKEGKQKEPRSEAQASIQMQEEPVVVQQDWSGTREQGFLIFFMINSKVLIKSLMPVYFAGDSQEQAVRPGKHKKMGER